MVRYARQRDGFRCVPVAMLNILKWAGYKEFFQQPVSIKLVPGLLSSLCLTTREGTYSSDFGIALGYIRKLEVRYIRDIEYKRIKYCLETGGIVALDNDYYDRRQHKWIGHVCVIVEYDKDINWYRCANIRDNETVTIINSDQLRYMLSSGPNKPNGWMIWKKEDVDQEGEKSTGTSR